MTNTYFEGDSAHKQFATNRKYRILFVSKPTYLLPDKGHKPPRPITSHHKKPASKTMF